MRRRQGFGQCEPHELPFILPPTKIYTLAMQIYVRHKWLWLTLKKILSGLVILPSIRLTKRELRYYHPTDAAREPRTSARACYCTAEMYQGTVYSTYSSFTYHIKMSRHITKRSSKIESKSRRATRPREMGTYLGKQMTNSHLQAA